MISCRNIHKSYGQLHVLKGIDLEVRKGEIVCITGESGAGKSTLLHIMGTLDKPDEGDVLFGDDILSRMSSSRLSAYRNRNMGFVFQFHQLLPEFSALENACIPAWIKGESRKNTMARGMELLNYLGLAERAGHRPSQLSGGEQQRVAVARALINQPGVVFADEPSGNLDSKNAGLLHEYFKRLRDDFGQTFVIVTHNPDLAMMGDRHVRMRDGVILAD